MPKGVQDAKLWSKALAQATKGGYQGDSLTAVAMGIYKRMGGAIGAKQALAPSAAAQLQRGKAKGKESTSTKKTPLRPLLESEPFPTWFKGKTFESLSGASAAGTRIRCVLISEGPGNQRDKNYYTRQAIEDAGARGIFEGVRCYLNHQNEMEQMEHPVNTIENLAGFFINTRAEQVRGTDGVARLGITGELVPDRGPAGQEVYAKALAQIKYKKLLPNSQDCYAGLSINGGGKITGTIDIGGDAWNQVVAFEGIESVDAVTRPARGGEFQAILESVQKPKTHEEEPMRIREMQRKLMNLEVAMIKESDPVKLQKLEEDKDALVKHAISKMAAMGGAKGGAEVDPEEEENEDLPADPEGEPVDPEENEGEGEGEGESEQMEALKGAIPQGEAEEDEAYEARIHAAHQAAFPKKEAKPKEGKKPKEAAVRVVATGNRLAEAERLELEALRAARRRAEDIRMAKSLLAEAELPERYCSVKSLLGKTKEQMEATINSLKNFMEDFAPDGGPLAPITSVGSRRAKEGDASAIKKELEEANLIGESED